MTAITDVIAAEKSQMIFAQAAGKSAVSVHLTRFVPIAVNTVRIVRKA